MSRGVNLTFENLDNILCMSALFYMRSLLLDQSIDIKRAIEICEKYGVACDTYREQDMNNSRALAIVSMLMAKIEKGGVSVGDCI